MSKTPHLGPVIAAMLLSGATASFAAPTSGGGATARGHVVGAVADLNAWDGHRLAPAGITAVGEGDLSAGVAPLSWEEGTSGPYHYGADGGARTTSEFVGASKLANLTPEPGTDPLPLSQFSGTHAKPPPGHAAVGVWDIVNRVRYGHLPEPASWALMLIGFGMIGAALRGFVVANRRLARLQPEDGE